MKMLNKEKDSVLCLWSGGLDSTYMLMQYLAAGVKVETCYVNFRNNTQKTIREKQAIENIMKLLQSRGYILKHSEIETEGAPGKMFAMMIPLLTGLYTRCNSAQTHVAIGYCMSDDAISFLKEIKQVWKSYAALGVAGRSDGLPKLIFPLVQVSKHHMVKNLHTDELLNNELLEMVTWCENYIDEKDRCGECVPCKKMISYGLQQELAVNPVEEVTEIVEKTADSADLQDEVTRTSLLLGDKGDELTTTSTQFSDLEVDFDVEDLPARDQLQSKGKVRHDDIVHVRNAVKEPGKEPEGAFYRYVCNVGMCPFFMEITPRSAVINASNPVPDLPQIPIEIQHPVGESSSAPRFVGGFKDLAARSAALAEGKIKDFDIVFVERVLNDGSGAFYQYRSGVGFDVLPNFNQTNVEVHGVMRPPA